MRILHYFLILSVIIFTSCNDDTFVSYHFAAYSLIDRQNRFEESSFISGDSLIFRLNSYQILKDYYKLEPIDLSYISLTCDDNILIENDTIYKNENILLKIPDRNMIAFNTQSSSSSLNYYLIIHSVPSYKLKLNNRYYLFKIKAKTVNGFDARDSILTKYNNR